MYIHRRLSMSYSKKIEKEEFRKEFNDLFISYLTKLDSLAFSPEFQATGNVTDLTEKRKLAIVNKAIALLADFESIHTSEMPKFFSLIKKYNTLQSAEKRDIAREQIQIYKNQLRRLLTILNAKAEVLVEELEERNTSFDKIKPLKKLAILKVEDIENFWLTESGKVSPLL
jgi:uncharacterized protein YfkK (UPF0435 family)